MATLKGIGALFGIGTNATAGVVINAASHRTGSDYTWSATVDELESTVGETVGLAVRNKRKEITITVVVCSDAVPPTLADAGTEINTVLKTPGTAVTITSAVGGTSLTEIAGSYMLLASRFRETNTGFAVLECDLIKHDGISSYADIA